MGHPIEIQSGAKALIKFIRDTGYKIKNQHILEDDLKILKKLLSTNSKVKNLRLRFNILSALYLKVSFHSKK